MCPLLTEKKGITLSATAYPGAPYGGYLLKSAKENGESNTATAIQRI
ncbi:MAG: hypothetical protein QRY72_01350 [Candidatus Rhabdochlamydia sp.]